MSKITKKLESRFIGIIQLSQELILNRYGHVPEAQVMMRLKEHHILRRRFKN